MIRRNIHAWSIALGALVVTQCGWALWTSAAGLPSRLTNITLSQSGGLYRYSSVEAELFTRVLFHLANGQVISDNGLGRDHDFFVLRGKVSVNRALQGTALLTTKYGPPALSIAPYATSIGIGTGKFRLEDITATLTNQVQVDCVNLPGVTYPYYLGCVNADAHADLTHYNTITGGRRTTRFNIGKLHAVQQVYCSSGQASCYPVIYGAIYERP